MKTYTKKRRGHFIFETEELKIRARREADRRGINLSQLINLSIKNEIK